MVQQLDYRGDGHAAHYRGAGTIRPELNAKLSAAGQGGCNSRWLCVVTGGARDVMDRPYL